MTAITPEALDRPAAGPMVRLARLLGCTEGQAYTLLLGTVLALVAALVGLPPTLRDRAQPSAATSAAGGDASAAPASPDDRSPAPADAPSPSADGASPSPSDGPAAQGGSAPAPATPGPAPGAAAPVPPPPTGTVAPSGLGRAELAARVGDPGAPDGVAVDDRGRVHVATNNGLVRGGAGASKVLRYGANGRLQEALAVKGQDATRAGGLTGVLVAPDGRVLVLDSAPARVLRVDLDRDDQDTHATLADLPACGPSASTDACETGADHRPQPRAAALDAAGNLFVTDSGQGLIWRVSRGGKAAPWYVFADDETAAGPTGIALDGAGDVLVVTSVALRGSTGSGLVQRIDVRRDGTAGRRKAVAETEPLSGPVGLSVTPGGGIVVALTSANVIVLLGPDGTETARLTADDVGEHAGVPLDGPTGVTVRGTSVFVTNQSPAANDESHWVVFDIPLTE